MMNTNSGADLISQLLLQLNDPLTRQHFLSRYSRIDEDLTPTNRPLFNDTCQETIAAEQRFVSQLGLFPIETQDINTFDNHEDQLVLHSRALGNRYFLLPIKDASMSPNTSDRILINLDTRSLWS